MMTVKEINDRLRITAVKKGCSFSFCIVNKIRAGI